MGSRWRVVRITRLDIYARHTCTHTTPHLTELSFVHPLCTQMQKHMSSFHPVSNPRSCINKALTAIDERERSRSLESSVDSYSLLLRTEIWVTYPKHPSSSARQHQSLSSFSPCDNCRIKTPCSNASHREKTQRQPHVVKQRASVSNPKQERMLQCSSPQLTSSPTK